MMKGKLKQWKQLVSVLLISVLVLSMAAPGFASVGTSDTSAADNTLTITSEISGHTYELYQIFGGDLVEDDDKDKTEYLTNIIWGDGINPTTAYIEALQADTTKVKDNTTLGGMFADVNSDTPNAVEVAYVLSQIASYSDAANAFAEVTKGYLNTVNAKSPDSKDEATTAGAISTYTFKGLHDGYYLLKDEDGSLKVGTEDQVGDTPAYTLYILYIVGGRSTTVEAKSDKPTIDKYIIDPDTIDKTDVDEAEEKSEEYSIGSVITYQLTSSVPDMTGYDRYWFMIKDTLSKGLDYIQIESVKVGTGDDTKTLKEVAKGEEENYTYTLDFDGVDSDAEEYSIYITLNNFKESYGGESYKNAPIVVRYQVRMNQYANIGETGNDNTVNLYYSNDPYYDYDGEPGKGDEPGPEDDNGFGQTQDKKTIVYTTQLRLVKTDALTGAALSGAKFALTSKDGTTYYTLVTEETESVEFTLDNDNGTYVKVNENPDEYVLYDPSNPEHAGYTTFYKRTSTGKDTTYYVTTQTQSGQTEIVGETGENGYITFIGLGAGEYELEEIAAPNGYRKLAEPISVSIYFADPTIAEGVQPDIENYKCEWGVEVNGADSVDATGGIITISVTNTSSVFLPSTGGIGTVVFTVVGLCAMAGAVIFLYMKKRKEEL